MFAWFSKGQRGSFIARYEGKIIHLSEDTLTRPGLFQIEIIQEYKTYYRARILNQAAMLELPETGEAGSVRLQLALEAFGPFAERISVNRTNEDPLIRLYWSGIQQEPFDREIDQRVLLRSKTRRRAQVKK